MRIYRIDEEIEIKDRKNDPSSEMAQKLLASLPPDARFVQLPLPVGDGIETGYIGHVRIIRFFDPIHSKEFIRADCGIEE